MVKAGQKASVDILGDVMQVNMLKDCIRDHYPDGISETILESFITWYDIRLSKMLKTFVLRFVILLN